MNDHLTDDQIDDALIDDLAESCATHLAACASCQLRLAQAEEPIATFNAVSLAWSERASATMPLRPIPATRAAWLPRALWAATAAAVLAVGVAVPVLRHYGGAHTTADAQPDTPPTLMASTGPVDNPVAAREEQIARDNQMLESIDRELAASSSVDGQYDFQTISTHTTSHPVSLPVRN